jgi:hypothetical protein
MPITCAAAALTRPAACPPLTGARATLYAASSPEAPQKGAASEGYFDSNCTPRMPGPAALDDLSCCWLWRWSSERVALEPRYELPAVSK